MSLMNDYRLIIPFTLRHTTLIAIQNNSHRAEYFDRIYVGSATYTECQLLVNFGYLTEMLNFQIVRSDQPVKKRWVVTSLGTVALNMLQLGYVWDLYDHRIDVCSTVIHIGTQIFRLGRLDIYSFPEFISEKIDLFVSIARISSVSEAENQIRHFYE